MHKWSRTITRWTIQQSRIQSTTWWHKKYQWPLRCYFTTLKSPFSPSSLLHHHRWFIELMTILQHFSWRTHGAGPTALRPFRGDGWLVEAMRLGSKWIRSMGGIVSFPTVTFVCRWGKLEHQCRCQRDRGGGVVSRTKWGCIFNDPNWKFSAEFKH